MGPTPILKMAVSYGLHPRLWLLIKSGLKQAFSWGCASAKLSVIVAAMLDLQNLRLIPSPLVALSSLPNLHLLLKSKMVAI